jgi:flagellar protein FliJ
MARPFRLQVLLDLTQQRVDAATSELQRLHARWNEARSELDQLQADSTEYSARLGARLTQGMSMHQLNDYRVFLDKLAQAVQAQSQEVDQRRRDWEEGHARWLGLRQRHQALAVLAQRHSTSEAVVEARREQRAQDEFALKAAKEPPFHG